MYSLVWQGAGRPAPPRGSQRRCGSVRYPGRPGGAAASAQVSAAQDAPLAFNVVVLLAFPISPTRFH